jgi:hypothetical protein
MTLLIVIGIAVMAAGFLFAAGFGRNRARRERSLAASGDSGFVPWIDGGSTTGDCHSSGAADAGCGDGGGGGGGAGGE